LTGDGERYVGVSEILVHPSYKAETTELDFAVLRLQESVPQSVTTGYVCLPQGLDSSTFAGTALKIRDLFNWTNNWLFWPN
jgi:hypothetical protein